jgi:hypothetical protein
MEKLQWVARWLKTFTESLRNQWLAPNASERIGCYQIGVSMEESDKDKATTATDNSWIRGGINE